MPLPILTKHALVPIVLICALTTIILGRAKDVWSSLDSGHQITTENLHSNLTQDQLNRSSTSSRSENTDACFNEIAEIGSTCGQCRSKYVSFNGTTDRCTCAQCANTECSTCQAVLLSSSSTSLLLHPFPPRHLGFTSQLNDVVGHLADACLSQSHLLYGGMKLDALNKSSPLVPLDTMLSVEAVNMMLSTHANCSRTRLLPWHCSKTLLLSHFSTIRCTHNIHWTNGKNIRSLEAQLGQLFPLNLERAFSSSGSMELSVHSGGYNAVHFNLDCDWLLYLERRLARSGKKDFQDRSGRVKGKNFSMVYCSEGSDKSIKKVADMYITGYVNATRQMGHDLPILLASSIGKSGHISTEWVLKEYKRNLGIQYVFFESGSKSVHRELNAAAELKLLLAAKKFTGLSTSTFSNLVAQRVSKHSGGRSTSNVFMADSYL